VEYYPVKLKKAKVKQRYFTYLVISHNGYTYIQQRTGNDIWKQMFEFPLIEHDGPAKPEELGGEIERLTGLKQVDAEITGLSETVRHQLTHRTINARFVHLRIINGGFSPPQRWKKVVQEEIADYPLPRLIDRYLELHPDLKLSNRRF
jgi:A/G-specific adenine glycosylase